jgi:hypothetical protein
MRRKLRHRGNSIYHGTTIYYCGVSYFSQIRNLRGGGMYERNSEEVYRSYDVALIELPPLSPQKSPKSAAQP